MASDIIMVYHLDFHLNNGFTLNQHCMLDFINQILILQA